MRQLALVSALLIPTLVGAQANDALPREFGCIAQDEISNDMHSSELARIVRACATEQRYDDAVQVYYIYSSYGLYDQQRVRDESAHVVLGELSQWMFAFLDRTTMTGIRASIDKLRDPEHPFFQDTCVEIEELGRVNTTMTGNTRLLTPPPHGARQ